MSSQAPTGERTDPLVTVIIPTHSHADTVDLACRSVLTQSVRQLELVVIGDGVTPEVRAAIAALPADERVRFIDGPKSSSRAEQVRHQVILEAVSPYICYLGDDDIMLPDHLASTLDRLEDVDFTHPLPVFIDGQGTLGAHLTDLAEPRCRLWHQHPFRNAVSLTGVGHRLDAYRKLPYGWRETPPGRWSDHYMWQQWFATPGLKYATGDRLTVLKFEASGRGDMTGEQRRAETVAWLQRSRQPGFDAWLADQAAGAVRRAAIELRLDLDFQTDQFTLVRDAMAEREASLRSELAQLSDRAAAATAETRAIQASRTWRIRNRLVRFPPLSWLSRA